MRYTIFLFLLFCLSANAQKYVLGSSNGKLILPTDNDTIVFLSIGQSNMLPSTGGSGSGNTETFPSGTLQWGRFAPNDGTLIDATVPLEHEGNDSNPGRGPGLMTQFAIDYKAQYPNRTIVIVPAAVGGTNFLSGDWNQGDPQYTDAVNRTNAVLAANPGFVFGGFLWHQGESDAGWSGYELALDTFIADIRTDVTGATATTPFVLGGLLPSWYQASQDRIDTMAVIEDTPNRNSNVAFASSLLPTELVGADVIHFDSDSSLLLGGRYFDAYMTLTHP